jgi:molecular chaperone IbpA
MTLPRNKFIGFDSLLHELERLSNHTQDPYPPHNVIKLDETQTIIEVAVAGFNNADLEIELKDDVLTIIGSKKPKFGDSAYIYKGISAKRFVKSFRLSEHIEVVEATVVDGILSIILLKVPKEKLSKKINIKTHK